MPPPSQYQKTDLNPLFHSIVLKPISASFLASETAMLPIYSKVYQYELEKNSLADTMQNSPALDQSLPPDSFVSHRNFEAVQFPDNLKPYRNGPFKINSKPTEVTYEILPQDGGTFHTHRNHLIPYYPKELLLIHLIWSKNEQKSELFHDSDTSDMIQNDRYTSNDKYEFDDNLFDDDPFCRDDDDQSVTFNREFFKSAALNDSQYHIWGLKLDS